MNVQADEIFARVRLQPHVIWHVHSAGKKQKHGSLFMQIPAPVADTAEFLVHPHDPHVLDGLLDAGPGLLADDTLSDFKFVAAKLTSMAKCGQIRCANKKNERNKVREKEHILRPLTSLKYSKLWDKQFHINLMGFHSGAQAGKKEQAPCAPPTVTPPARSCLSPCDLLHC